MSPVSRFLSLVSCLWYHVSCFMFPVSCIMSLVSFLLSQFSSLLSHVSCPMSPVLCLMFPVLWLLFPVSCLTYPVSCLRSPVSYLMSVKHKLCFNPLSLLRALGQLIFFFLSFPTVYLPFSKNKTFTNDCSPVLLFYIILLLRDLASLHFFASHWYIAAGQSHPSWEGDVWQEMRDRQETWDRLETWDRQFTWERRHKTGDMKQTGNMRQSTGDLRQ